MILNEIEKLLRDIGFEVIKNDEEKYTSDFLKLVPNYEFFLNNRLAGSIIDGKRYSKLTEKSKKSKIKSDLTSLVIIYEIVIFAEENNEMLIYQQDILDDNGELLGKKINSEIINGIKSICKDEKFNLSNDVNRAESIIDDFFKRLNKYNQKNYIGLFDEYVIKNDELKSIFFVDENKRINEYDDSKFSLLLFNLFIEPYQLKSKLYRYIDLQSVFETINNKTYRICSIQGMNDQTEGSLPLNLIMKNLNINSDELIDIYDKNDIFISSFSLSFDNLTMWRLYGDNSRGVIMSMENTKKKLDNFYLNKVAYLDEKFSFKMIILFVFLNELSKNSLTISPRIFKYLFLFIKDKRYSIEKEIRLLYINTSNNIQIQMTKKWSIAKPFNIVRPYIDVDNFNDSFLLKLKSIILGPNLPHKQLNSKQLLKLSSEKDFNGLTVEISKIPNDLYIV